MVRLKWIAFLVWLLILCLAPLNRSYPLIFWILPALLSFFSYFLFLGRWEILSSFRTLFLIGLGARVVFLSFPPGFSEDVYRFEWDARMLDRGEDPYSRTPLEVTGLTSEEELLLGKLNSKEYHSVYPPALQWVFFSAFSLSEYLGIPFHLIHRIYLILVEIIILFLLGKLLAECSMDNRMSMTYFLHPMAILEFSGNGHPEPWMIIFLLMGVYFFLKKRVFFFSLFNSLAIGVKFLPVFSFPALFRLKDWKRSWMPVVLSLLILPLLFLPFASSGELRGIGNSLDLFFRRFEFNAGIYYLIREFLFLFTGFNVIFWLGPALSFLFILLVFIRSVRFPTATTVVEIFKEYELIFILFFLLSTTIHPWYLATPLIFSVFTQSRYSALWMGLSFLSYVHYSELENLYPLFVFLEYTVLFTALIKEGYFLNLIRVSEKKSVADNS